MSVGLFALPQTALPISLQVYGAIAVPFHSKLKNIQGRDSTLIPSVNRLHVLAKVQLSLFPVWPASLCTCRARAFLSPFSAVLVLTAPCREWRDALQAATTSLSILPSSLPLCVPNTTLEVSLRPPDSPGARSLAPLLLSSSSPPLLPTRWDSAAHV